MLLQTTNLTSSSIARWKCPTQLRGILDCHQTVCARQYSKDRRLRRSVCYSLTTWFETSSETSFLPWQQLTGLLAVGSFLAYQERPRGWCSTTLVQVEQSRVAGLGVFAKRPISQGTVVGGYPGLPRNAKDMLTKAMRVPRCQQYVFQISGDLWLDPTNNDGYPSSKLIAFIPFLHTDISMAYVNEPPTGQTVNIDIRDTAGGKNANLQLVAVQNIDQDQELFIDYGSVYDRSSYGSKQ